MSTTFSRRAASVVAAAVLGLVGAAPATAHQAHGAEHHRHSGEHHSHGHGHGHSKRIDYVNLGDSYSAAIGTGAITESPLLAKCMQGEGPDHVSALDAKRRVNLLVDAACSGATAENVQVIASSVPVTSALRRAELVTLTLGGNNIGWVETIKACSLQGDAGTCDALIADAPRRIGVAADSARRTVADIDARTRGQVVVLGYPRLFSEAPGSPLVSPQRAAQLNDLTDQFNAALERAVEHADAAEFVDVAPRFEGHAVDSQHPWIYFDADAPADPNNLHPNERGYLFGYYEAFEDQIGLGHLGRR